MHDPVCNHCRSRKVKCGRERPKCANCRKDNIQCDYSDQGKRVNHTKLLVNNVSGLDENLVVIRKQLNRLLETVETGGAIRPHQKNDAPHRRTNVMDAVNHNMPQRIFRKDSACITVPQATTDRHVVRSPDSSERFHGSCTLFSLSKSFETTVRNSHRFNTSKGPQPSQGESQCEQELDGKFQLLLAAAGSVQEICLTREQCSINLPPRQLLRVASTFLFTQNDPNLDLFSQSDFSANAERLYSTGPSSMDYAWVLSLNLIVLLILNMNQTSLGTDTAIASHFANDLLSTVTTALKTPELHMTPRLVNIQALILLNVALQQCLQPDLAAATFAHACFLAKHMGLHQRGFDYENLSEDSQSQVKVFFYLFVRDKSLSLARGDSCWLPYSDCSIAFENADKYLDKVACLRIELATLQEELYRRLYSATACSQDSVQKEAAVTTLKDRLTVLWETSAPQRPVDLEMDLLATRMAAYRHSESCDHREQIITDAKAYCHTFVRAAQQEGIITSSSSLSLVSPDCSNEPSRATDPGSTGFSMQPGDKSTTPQIRYLAESFLPLAFFVLAETVALSHPTERQVELAILDRISRLLETFCCRDSLPPTQCTQVSETFLRVMDVLNILKSPRNMSQSPRLPTPGPSVTAMSQGFTFGQELDLDQNTHAATEQGYMSSSLVDFSFTDPLHASSVSNTYTLTQASVYNSPEYRPTTKRPRCSMDEHDFWSMDSQNFMTSDLMAAIIPGMNWS